MANLRLTCRCITTFNSKQEFDEDAFRQYITRMADSKVEVFVTSSGSGQGSQLTDDDIRRVCKTAVEAAKGKVKVNANLPNRTAANFSVDIARIAIAAGVDSVHLYGPSGHRSTADETIKYFDTMLSAINHPVSIGPNHVTVESTPQTMAAIANKWPQVHTIMIMGQDDSYYIALRDALKRDVEVNVPFLPPLNPLHSVLMGANGIITNAGSILPKTYRLYTDYLDKRDLDGVAKTYRDLVHFQQHTSKFHLWHKTAMRAFKQAGAFVRAPETDPTEADVQRFLVGLPALHIAEVDELLRNAGVVAKAA